MFVCFFIGLPTRKHVWVSGILLVVEKWGVLPRYLNTAADLLDKSSY